MYASNIYRQLAVLAAIVALVAALRPSDVRATPQIGSHDVATLFYIAKSDDRNRVDYGVQLDAACAPIGDAPLYAYWRRFEPGQPRFGDLNLFDAAAYAIASQEVRVRETTGSWIEFRVRSLTTRRLLALVRRDGERCTGVAQTTIDGQEAILHDVFVELDGPMSIREVVLRGQARVSGQPVIERMHP